MYDKANVATFPVLSSNNSVIVLLNALTKPSKVSLQRLLPKSFAGSVNPRSTFSNRKYKDQRGFFLLKFLFMERSSYFESAKENT